jgi:Ca2+/Na+ antiporter
MDTINKLDTWLALGTWANIGRIIALLVLVAAVTGFVRAVSNSKNDFNLLDLFVEGGKLGGSKMRVNGAWLVSTWAFIYFTVDGKLTEWYVAAYLTAFVFDRFNSRKGVKEEVTEQLKKDANK